MRHFSGYLVLLVLAGFVVVPAVAAAQSPVPVQMELYKGDRDTQHFTEALRAAVTGDSRFAVVDTLPDTGLKIIVDESLQPQNNDDVSLAGYTVQLKLGSGKWVGSEQGLCDLAKLAMCGRIVAEDSYNTYTAFMAKQK